MVDQIDPQLGSLRQLGDEGLELRSVEIAPARTGHLAQPVPRLLETPHHRLVAFELREAHHATAIVPVPRARLAPSASSGPAQSVGRREIAGHHDRPVRAIEDLPVSDHRLQGAHCAGAIGGCLVEDERIMERARARHEPTAALHAEVRDPQASRR